jgi:hypothetical protein
MLIEKLLDNFDITTIIVMIIVGVSLVVYIISKISSIIVEKKLKPIAEMLNAEIKSSFPGGTYINILNYGPEIHLKLNLGGKDSPSFLILELLNPIGFQFKMVKKQTLNQMFFIWGEEVELNDPFFKEEYLIRSDKPYEASSYLTDSRRVEAMKYFFENGFNRIEANNKGVYVNKINYTDEDLTLEKVQAYLDNLNSFTRM